ncbi:SusC/RagA family TonB-linked outer membrane protein [Sphingobacterium siyangense]|uniref:SusC/RagA family TonB-linked outer membrane protein n=1 Tax=Sphingobacterium siyangense TaxID=459529 RepID=UPI003DA69AC1
MNRNYVSSFFCFPKERNRKVKWLLMASMLMGIGRLSAQEKVIHGKIISDQGKPIIGASIKVKDKTLSTSTNEKGEFVLKLNPGEVLIVSNVGYNQAEYVIGNSSEISIPLVAAEIAVDEVVVVGYGKQKKVDLTSSIAVVDTKDLVKVPGGTIATLQSAVPGVQVTNGAIRIRGVGSINGTDPLYVVDGMIGGAMPDENNIASIQVLKDAASSAIYGARGANGVILVTTKRGKAGDVKLDYNAFAGIKNISHNVPLLNGQQLAELINEEMYNKDPSRTDYLAALSKPAAIGKGYNMMDELLQTGNYQRHNLSVSGGSQNANFRLSGIYATDKSIIIQDKNKYYGAQFISDFTKGKLKIGETLSLGYTRRNWSDKNIIDAQKWSSTLPLYDANSSTGFAGAGNGTDVQSALANAYLNKNVNDNFSVNGNAWATYEIIKGLVYKFNMGIDLSRVRNEGYIGNYAVGQYQNHSPDELNISSSQNNRWLFENTLTYENNFGKHAISALAGITSEESRYNAVNAGARGLPSPDVLILNSASLASSRLVGSGVGQSAMYSMLGRVNYNYDNRYLLTFNMRRDGSANFSNQYRYGNFPSVSAGWRISQESFMKTFPAISELKLRGSYGLLGNSDIAQYQYQRTVSFDHVWYYLNNVMVTGALPQTPYNPNVKWESQYSTDLGLDLELFEHKLALTVDYYNKKTEDMLINVPISFTAGYVNNFPVLNAGSIRNRGWDILASYKDRVGNFSYHVGANISFVKNRVLSLGNNNEILWGSISPGGENVTRTAVGRSVGEFWGYTTNGLYTSQAQLDADKAFAPNASLGDVRFNDRNGDKILNDQDKDFLGSPIPDFSYGFNADVNYSSSIGRFDLSMMWQGSKGNDIYNNSRYWGEGMYHYYNNFASTLDRYRAEELVFKNPVSGETTVYPKNTDTTIPRAVLGDPNQNLRASNRFVEDGSYLRLKVLNIGYSFSSPRLERWKIDRLRFYVGAKNLLTFTKYSGYDPEVGSGDTRSNLSRGIDGQTPWGLSFPNSREYFMGIQFTF